MGKTYVNGDCKSFKRYQGKSKPRCNDGKGCRGCWYVYHSVQQGQTAEWAKLEWIIKY